MNSAAGQNQGMLLDPPVRSSSANPDNSTAVFQQIARFYSLPSPLVGARNEPRANAHLRESACELATHDPDRDRVGLPPLNRAKHPPRLGFN